MLSSSVHFYAEAVERAGFIPAIQNAAATLAGLQCEAAINALHQATAQFEARAFDLNIRSGRSVTVKLSTDPVLRGHSSLIAEPPMPLSTTADETVADLLQEIASHLTGPPTIFITTPLVWTSACVVCRQLAVWFGNLCGLGKRRLSATRAQDLFPGRPFRLISQRSFSFSNHA